MPVPKAATKDLANRCLDNVSEYMANLDITTEEGYNSLVEMTKRLDDLVLEVDCRINGITI